MLVLETEPGSSEPPARKSFCTTFMPAPLLLAGLSHLPGCSARRQIPGEARLRLGREVRICGRDWLPELSSDSDPGPLDTLQPWKSEKMLTLHREAPGAELQEHVCQRRKAGLCWLLCPSWWPFRTEDTCGASQLLVLISFLGSHPSITDTYTYSALILPNYLHLWGMGDRSGLFNFGSLMHGAAGINTGL